MQGETVVITGDLQELTVRSSTLLQQSSPQTTMLADADCESKMEMKAKRVPVSRYIVNCASNGKPTK